MKVLLVQQDLGIREVKHPMFPIGLSYIAAALREHGVKIFDPNAYDPPSAFKELQKEVKNFKPDIVGLSIRNIDTMELRNLYTHYKTVRPTIQRIKEIDPRIIIIVGGTGFSLFAKDIMERISEIDFGIYLEGEESTPELLANLKTSENVKGIFIRKDGKVCFTGQRPFLDFANLPIPRMDPDVIDMTTYMGPSYNIIGIQSKRGCILECAYCSYPFLNGKYLRLRDPVMVVDQIEYMVKEFGMEHFAFVDSVFNIPEKHAIEICKEIIQRKLNVRWGAWCHVNNFSEEFLSLAKEAGAIQIDFSPDAVTNNGFTALKKGITQRDIKKNLKIVRKVKGVGIGYNFFCSIPGQTFMDTVRTLILLFKIPLLLPGRGGVGLGWIRIEPYTEIYQTAIKEGIINKDTALLPENEEELAKLFYVPPSQRYSYAMMNFILTLVERVLKPNGILFFRLLAKIKGKKSIYDSKSGFMMDKKYK